MSAPNAGSWLPPVPPRGSVSRDRRRSPGRTGSCWATGFQPHEDRWADSQGTLDRFRESFRPG